MATYKGFSNIETHVINRLEIIEYANDLMLEGRIYDSAEQLANVFKSHIETGIMDGFVKKPFDIESLDLINWLELANMYPQLID